MKNTNLNIKKLYVPRGTYFLYLNRTIINEIHKLSNKILNFHVKFSHNLMANAIYWSLPLNKRGI